MIKIPPHQIHLWHFIHPDAGQEIDFAKGFLVQAEIERSTKIRNPEVKAQFIYSRSFLRNVLSQYTEYEPKELSFATEDGGKPYIAQNTPIRFNLSHTHSLSSIVVTDNIACGIDIEQSKKIGQDYLDLSPRFMNKCELEYFDTLDIVAKLSRFASIWTIKEAYIKTLGAGLSYNLSDIHIDKLESFSPIIHDRNILSTQQSYSIIRLDLGNDFVGACVIKSKADDNAYFSATINSLSAFTAPITLQRIKLP